MDRLVDLIKIYDNDLDDEVCDYLIEHFENSNLSELILEPINNINL